MGNQKATTGNATDQQQKNKDQNITNIKSKQKAQMPKYTTANLLPEKNNNNYPDLNKPTTRKEQQNSKKNNFQKIKLLQKLPQKTNQLLYRKRKSYQKHN